MPVATANKVPRSKGGKNRGGDVAGNTKVPEIERPAVTPLGRKVAMTFNWLQDEGVPMAKAIAKLRSVYNEASALGNNGLEDFFLYTSFFLQLPISSGTVKERMGKADEKILETICKFAVSFLQVLIYIIIWNIFETNFMKNPYNLYKNPSLYPLFILGRTRGQTKTKRRAKSIFKWNVRGK